MVDGAPGLLGGHAWCLKVKTVREFKKARKADIEDAPVRHHHAVEKNALETIVSSNPV